MSNHNNNDITAEYYDAIYEDFVDNKLTSRELELFNLSLGLGRRLWT